MHYKLTFIDRYEREDFINDLRKEFGSYERIIDANLVYLKDNGYIGIDGLSISIRGIKFVEKITDGDLDFDIDDIDEGTLSLIRRVFRENDNVQ